MLCIRYGIQTINKDRKGGEREKEGPTGTIINQFRSRSGKEALIG